MPATCLAIEEDIVALIDKADNTQRHQDNLMRLLCVVDLPAQTYESINFRYKRSNSEVILG